LEQFEEALLALAGLLREDEYSVGSGDALDTGGDIKNLLAVRAEWAIGAARLHTVPVSVVDESWQTVANLLAEGVISEDPVGSGVTVGAEVGLEGAGCAGGVALPAGEGPVGVHNLVESCGADALTVAESAVVSDEARCAVICSVASLTEG
jgi:hypothetical protein